MDFLHSYTEPLTPPSGSVFRPIFPLKKILPDNSSITYNVKRRIYWADSAGAYDLVVKQYPLKMVYRISNKLVSVYDLKNDPSETVSILSGSIDCQSRPTDYFMQTQQESIWSPTLLVDGQINQEAIRNWAEQSCILVNYHFNMVWAKYNYAKKMKEEEKAKTNK
eukprot:TRINITY_DN7663_c0_g1_i2.p1 TRINITY_DN7663_c0_g1~~TRINITY_DN7663_c0_g1_i2.p1  ORF type:complete len:165 (+),score=17.56 TRINITY_DN7663_c0_g1_i2:84-578(+)